MSSFSTQLHRLREEAGHTSARAFFKALGGRPFFGCTYKQYLNVESGRSVPGPALVERIATGLRLANDERRSREFALAYLESALKSKPLIEFLVAALSREPAAATPLRQAIKKSWGERTEALTHEESDLIRASRENYWCFTVPANDRSRWTPEELVRLLGFESAAVKAALSKLLKARLLEKDKEGRYFSPKAGRVFLHPRDDLYVPKVVESLRKNWDQMADKKGAVLLHQHLFTRASESGLRNYFPYLAQAIQGADVYSAHERGPDTGFFLIETVVRRVMPF